MELVALGQVLAIIVGLGSSLSLVLLSCVGVAALLIDGGDRA